MWGCGGGGGAVVVDRICQGKIWGGCVLKDYGKGAWGCGGIGVSGCGEGEVRKYLLT